MKKFLLVITTIICCMSSSSHSQILNGGFETWNNGLPDNWWGILFPPYTLLTQSSTAHSGSYAVNLHVDDLGGQPFSSSLSTGNGSTTTHPLSFVPMTVSFWYKLNAVSGDEITLTALVYSGGTGAGVAAIAFPASANYTYVNTPILYGTIPPSADSIALIFLITNTGGTPHIGSDVFIDDVAISASSGMNNHTADNNFQITPNPADQFISIEFYQGMNRASHIFITDINGRLVYRNTAFNSEKFKIETGDFNPGVYYCTLRSGELESRKSVVINHE